MAKWFVHAHSGHRYGPVEREELDRWAAEGRVTARCQIWMEGWPEWRPAAEIFPQLQASLQQPMAGNAPTAGQQTSPGAQQAQQSGTTGSPFAAGSSVQSPVGQYQAPAGQSPYGAAGGTPLLPDRGAMIFVFGLLSFIFGCLFLAIPAWLMGASDLKQIEAGRRDPAGRGMTMAGMILGIVALVVSILAYIILFFMFAEESGMF